MRAIIVWVVLSAPLWALDVPERSKVGDFVTITHVAGSFVKITPTRSETQRIEVSPEVTVFTGLPGTYSVMEVTGEPGKWVENNATCVIGDQGPEPPNPPDPFPPDPGPGPGPSPTPGPLSVVIVYESADAQPEALYSTPVRGYLNSHCPKGVTGLPSWRLWDDDYTPAQLAGEDANMVAAYSRAKAESMGRMPWILIQGGGKVASVPLPVTEAAILDLLKKYGGA